MDIKERVSKTVLDFFYEDDWGIADAERLADRIIPLVGADVQGEIGEWLGKRGVVVKDGYFYRRVSADEVEALKSGTFKEGE